MEIHERANFLLEKEILSRLPVWSIFSVRLLVHVEKFEFLLGIVIKSHKLNRISKLHFTDVLIVIIPIKILYIMFVPERGVKSLKRYNSVSDCPKQHEGWLVTIVGMFIVRSHKL